MGSGGFAPCSGAPGGGLENFFRKMGKMYVFLATGNLINKQ